MSRISYVNGRYLPHGQAAVPVEDRGYQFADGVYEVIAVHRGRLVDERPHLDRLARSLAALAIPAPVGERALGLILRRVIGLNRLTEGSLYLQVTRGVAPRDHAFPHDAAPQLVITARQARPLARDLLEQGAAVITLPDLRWARRDIKSISLLPNVLGKQQAKAAGAYEAWLVEADGTVSEGTSSNAWIVTPAGAIVTHAAGPRILNGVTRLGVIEAARAAGIPVEERAFTVEEAKAAPEAFLTSTTALVVPVTRIDGAAIGGGRPGPVTLALRAAMLRRLDEEAGR